MRKIKTTLFAIIIIVALSNLVYASQEYTLYYGEGCPHCALVKEYMSSHNISGIILKELYHNSDNAREFNEYCDENNIPLMMRGVPFLITPTGDYYVGDKDIISFFENNYTSPRSTPETDNQSNTTLTIPLLIGAALVDAINPCAFAVLLILMTTILSTGKKKKALSAGLFFSAAIFISYFLMGLGLYSVIATHKISSWFSIFIGVFAIIIGLFNIKDYFWYGKGFLMEVPLSWRPKLQSLIKSITSPIGAFFIGFLVSLFLLPCTSGPYLVVIGMLGVKETFIKAFWLLVLYNLIFVVPMVLITFATYCGMNVEKAENERKSHLRLLHLIAGIIMLIMGITLLIHFI